LGKQNENFSTDKPDEDDYQIEKAKIAIASGKIYGLGPGKSVQKNFCNPSDFIYAIIVEEYGYRWLWCSNFIFIAFVSICCSLAQSQYALGKLGRLTRFSDDFQAMVIWL
jgi:cell division protein FtsW (lipid II flippase)